VIISTKVLAI